MRIAIAALALAGMAHAQTWTWMADVSDPVIEPGETVTVTLSAFMEYDTPFVALASFQMDVPIMAGVEAGSIAGCNQINHIVNKLSVKVFNDSFTDVDGGQLPVFGPFISDNPVDVFQFTWTAEAPGEVLYSTETFDAVIWAGDDLDSSGAVQVETINDAAFGWTVVPAPGVAWLALLAAWRRPTRTPPATAPGTSRSR